VVNVKDMVEGSPPTDGVYARHAIRDDGPGGNDMASSHNNFYQSLPSTCDSDRQTGSIDPCQSLYEAGVLIDAGVTPSGEGPLWNDTSVMGCADCHTTDGSNGDVGNAHGAESEYLLKNADGTAPADPTGEGAYDNGTYVCFKCHDQAQYDTTHTGGNSSDFQHSADQVGAGTNNPPNRTDFGTNNDGGSYTGIACMNCHGGAPGDKGTEQALNTPEAYIKGFGRIHGTSSVFFVGSQGSGERKSYRFTNGGSLRYYDPGTWNSSGRQSSLSCFTLGGADDWGGCVHHGSAGSGERQIPRPMTY
jgi:hypothetical protein